MSLAVISLFILVSEYEYEIPHVTPLLKSHNLAKPFISPMLQAYDVDKKFENLCQIVRNVLKRITPERYHHVIGSDIKVNDAAALVENENVEDVILKHEQDKQLHEHDDFPEKSHVDDLNAAKLDHDQYDTEQIIEESSYVEPTVEVAEEQKESKQLLATDSNAQEPEEQIDNNEELNFENPHIEVTQGHIDEDEEPSEQPNSNVFEDQIQAEEPQVEEQTISVDPSIEDSLIQKENEEENQFEEIPSTELPVEELGFEGQVKEVVSETNSLEPQIKENIEELDIEKSDFEEPQTESRHIEEPTNDEYTDLQESNAGELNAELHKFKEFNEELLLEKNIENSNTAGNYAEEINAEEPLLEEPQVLETQLESMAEENIENSNTADNYAEEINAEESLLEEPQVLETQLESLGKENIENSNTVDNYAEEMNAEEPLLEEPQVLETQLESVGKENIGEKHIEDAFDDEILGEEKNIEEPNLKKEHFKEPPLPDAPSELNAIETQDETHLTDFAHDDIPDGDKIDEELKLEEQHYEEPILPEVEHLEELPSEQLVNEKTQVENENLEFKNEEAFIETYSEDSLNDNELHIEEGDHKTALVEESLPGTDLSHESNAMNLDSQNLESQSLENQREDSDFEESQTEQAVVEEHHNLEEQIHEPIVENVDSVEIIDKESDIEETKSD